MRRGTRLRIYAGGVPSEGARAKSAEDSGARVESVSTSTHHVRAVETQEHRVKPGETLYSIARANRTTVSALKQANPFLAERSLQAGDVLAIQQ